MSMSIPELSIPDVRRAIEIRIACLKASIAMKMRAGKETLLERFEVIRLKEALDALKAPPTDEIITLMHRSHNGAPGPHGIQSA